MNALVLGSGAREHALGWALARDGKCRLWFGPGNAGTESLGRNLPALDPLDPEAVLRAARAQRIDLVVVGPEEPLARGVADRLRHERVPVFGPTREAALLETSKAYSKEFMARHHVPTASARTFRDFESFRAHVQAARGKLVVKKSGLAAGKGVLVAPEPPEALAFGRTVLRDDAVVVEEHLEGYELSLFVVLDGASHVTLPACADHKKALDGDQGPNTGGMGAVCPVRLEPDLEARIAAEVVGPTLRGIREERMDYRGVLFLGLMVGPQGCRVLEYNVRFGDPEAQVLLPALDIDWTDLITRAALGSLEGFRVRECRRSCVGVVVAAPGYPDRYPRGLEVSLPTQMPPDVHVFQASTTRREDGVVLTGGGRCFTVVGTGEDLACARRTAYAAVDGVRFPGAWYRHDIGARHAGA